MFPIYYGILRYVPYLLTGLLKYIKYYLPLECVALRTEVFVEAWLSIRTYSGHSRIYLLIVLSTQQQVHFSTR